MARVRRALLVNNFYLCDFDIYDPLVLVLYGDSSRKSLTTHDVVFEDFG